MSIDLLGAIFAGNITSWTDPELLVLNPYLTDWFGTDDANITVVVCCQSIDSPNFAYQILLYVSGGLFGGHYFDSLLFVCRL